MSLALFVIQWFVPLVFGKETIYPAYVLVRDLILHSEGFAMKLSVLATIAIFYAVRAVLLAWAVQAIVVIFRCSRSGKQRHAA
jgi:hypothetical protein